MGGIYYVYEHWRPDKGSCFYVGKGKGKRAHDFRRGRNRRHKFIVAALKEAGLNAEVRIIATCLSESEAFKLEVERIAFWRASGVAISNATDGGEGASGMAHSAEWKRAMSARMTGREVSAETRRKLSALALGNKRGLGVKKSAEAVEKTAAAHRGVQRSEDTRARISVAKTGKPGHALSQAHIEKIKAAHTGQKRSEATREKMRKPKSAEHRAKLSASGRGKSHSDETRAKLAEITRQQWAARRRSAQLSVGG
jgi:hypothetical protein